MKKITIALFSLILAGCSSFFEDFDYPPATFSVSGNSLVMDGVIDSNIKTNLQAALNDNPQVDTIIMQNVEGSVDDEANLNAAKLVRAKGLNTLIPSDGIVASGGTDFFLAGTKRTVEDGAKIGVHSWAGAGIDNAAMLPKSHPEHQKYLQYYEEMGIASEFNWYTLVPASSDDIHWMTPMEQKKYQLATP